MTSPIRRPEDGLGRDELQLVIRRAAELYAAEADSKELLSTDDVLHIAEELGLPARHVRQALYEIPIRKGEDSLAGRVYGPNSLLGTRVVHGNRRAALGRLRDHLVTRELLQIQRRQPGFMVLAPAEDTASRLVRTFRRPSGRFYLARSPAVTVAGQDLEPGYSQVRVTVDFEDRRRSAVTGGLIGGGIVGAGLAGVTFGVVDSVVGGTLGTTVAAAGGVAGMATGLGAGVTLTAARFRRRLSAARTELEGLLDRLEREDPLDPPPSPVRRWLQLKIGSGGSRST